MKTASTKYADANDLQIAYQVHGDGDNTLIIAPGVVSHVEINQEVPEYCEWLERLTEHFRVIIYDKQGQGLSDRSAGVPGPEQRMDDIAAIVAAEKLKKFSIFGYSEGAVVAMLYAATFPEQVSAIALFGGFARFTNCEGYDLSYEEEDIIRMVKHWGKGGFGYTLFPDKMPEMKEAQARFERACATPNAFRKMLETNIKIDIRAILSDIRVPTLVMHRRDDLAIPVANGRYLADNMPNADYVEFASGGHLPWTGNIETVVDTMMKFFTTNDNKVESSSNHSNVLSTILFTDIVGSSKKLSEIGDRVWRQTLDAHDVIAKREIERYQGRLIKNTGDGLLAIFNGPARAIKCAQAISHDVNALSIKIRCGLHIGEIEPRDNDITGLAVHVAARVMDLAGAGQILITRTLADVIAGSNLDVCDYGEHILKGLPENWSIYEIN